MKSFPLLLFAVLFVMNASANTYTRQDSLRGSNGRGRSWWDVQQYDLTVSIDTAKRTIRGTNTIALKVVAIPTDSLQVDLQDSMILDNARLGSQDLSFVREGNVYWLMGKFTDMSVGSKQELRLFFHGKPRTAKLPPWDGGFIWTVDSAGNPWVAVACQGLGASAWWPCKDYQGDEPDSGMEVSVLRWPQRKITAERRVPVRDTIMAAVCNGRPDTVLVVDPITEQESVLLSYRVKNPINNYNATFYLGNYIHWHDTVMGEKGKLDLDFYPLAYNEAKAREQFKQAKQMLHCFEYWMGPYPFYEDGYKLVEAPYLGMEHQSAIAYGNQYKMGYLGRDRSGTDIGMYFDYIIIHESGHEWFGNNITAQDVADNWIHEGFTTYTETLFTECLFNKDSAFKFMRGEWRNIRNDRPVIGDYGVNDDGSSDRYDKGAAVIHMVRVLMNDDVRFRHLLRGLNKDFYHRIVTSAQVENYIIKFTGLQLQPIFDQYLRTTKIPELEYFMIGKKLHYRFVNVEDGFTLPVTVAAENQQITITPNTKWHKVKWKGGKKISFTHDFLYTQRYTLE